MLFFLLFPVCEADQLSLYCTTTFVILSHSSLLLAFSLHVSSSSAFIISLFTQPSHLSCGLPHFLQPSSFFVSDLFCNLSSSNLTMCPTHFTRLLTILPTIQALVSNFFSEVFHSPYLHSLYTSYSPYPVVV